MPCQSSVEPCTFRVYRVDLEIRPDPTPEEREALVAALASAGSAAAGPYRSVWRVAGLLENVSEVGAPPSLGSAEPLRNSRGASRA